MVALPRLLRALLFVAATSLLVNDVVRLVCPEIQTPGAFAASGEKQEDNNPVNTLSLMEEEVKHHWGHEYFQVADLPFDGEGKNAAGHLIKNDDIRLLAFISIFSPPPNLA